MRQAAVQLEIGSSVKPAIARDTGHDPIDVLVRPFILAVFGEC
jgi:hypothetical protein